MSQLLELLREDLRDFAGYRSARSEAFDGLVWLNANESPWPNTADDDGSVRRYPDPQPQALRVALAALYDCAPEQLLIGRGSDEAIDLLVRAFCTPGRDAALVTPPVFGMYAVCARLQGARIIEVLACDEASGWRVDLDEVAEVALAEGAKLVFLCSPGNPTGELLSLPAISALARKLEGRALVVVDEAYGDYADAPSAKTLLADHANLVVLRTLSKAHALAAARIGCLIADAELIALLRRCQAPYPVPAPCAALALRALSPKALSRTKAHVSEAQQERERLRLALSRLPGVRRVYGGHGNFLLVRFDAVDSVFRRLLSDGIVVRDLRAWSRLDDALRISVGTPEQNDGVIAALSSLEAAA